MLRREYLKWLMASFINIPSLKSDWLLNSFAPLDSESWLQRIVADPGNDDLRLEYANWLLSNGNQMGRLIQQQVTLAKYDDTEAEYYDHAITVRNHLRGTNPFLSAINGDSAYAVWQRDQCPSDATDSNRVGDGEFERGMIQCFNPRSVASLLRDDQKLGAALPLVDKLEFWFQDSAENAYDQLNRLSWWPRIRGLKFRQCKLGDAGLRALALLDLSSVESIEFMDCALGAEGLYHLAKNDTFRPKRVSLLWCSFSEDCDMDVGVESDSFAAFLASPVAGSIEDLMVRKNLCAKCLATLSNDAFRGRIKNLELSKLNIDRDHWGRFFSGRFDNLQRLYAAANPPESPIQMDLSACPVLESLELKNLMLSEELVIPQLKHCSGLRRLNLASNGLTDAIALQVASEPALKNLRFLNLQDNQITEAGGCAIAGSEFLQQLVALKLSLTKVGDQTVGAMVDASYADRLAFLDLMDTAVTTAGVNELVKRRDWNSLRWLNLRDNGLTELDTTAMTSPDKFQRLNALSIQSGNSISDQAIRQLEQRFGGDALSSYWLGMLIS